MTDIDTPPAAAAADAAPADWCAILRQAIAADPRGKAGVAERMSQQGAHVSRAYVSRAQATAEGRRSGFASGVPDSFIRRVFDLEADVDCPATGGRIARAECRKALLPAPTHNPLAMRIWRHCQFCPIKPHPTTAASTDKEAS